MSIWYLGIDPGASGALALVIREPRDIIRIWPMPNYMEVLTTGKRRKSVDIDKLIEIYKVIQRMASADNIEIKVQIEKVQAYGKQSAPAAFNFGYASAIPYVAAKVFEWDIEYVAPISWKRWHGLQATEKDAARLKVLKYFPDHADIFRRKMDVDKADAVLIGFYRSR